MTDYLGKPSEVQVQEHRKATPVGEPYYVIVPKQCETAGRGNVHRLHRIDVKRALDPSKSPETMDYSADQASRVSCLFHPPPARRHVHVMDDDVSPARSLR
jgi:hypothetical protein